MSAIIKNQYNAVKEIVNQIEVLYKEYDNNPSDKNFNHFCKMFDYFLLITGNVTVGYYSVISNAMTPSGKSHLDWCKELFQQYESDLKKSGLLKPSFEDILSDVEDITPVETIEYTEEQKLSMWYENQKQYEYDTQF